MKLSDMSVHMSFTDDGKPTVSFTVTFDDMEQMTEYLGVLKSVFEKGLVEKESKEVIDALKKARNAGE